MAKPGFVINYLCLEDMSVGGAPATHTNEIISGLQKRGWLVNLCCININKSFGVRTTIAKILKQIYAQLQLFNTSFQPDIVYVRGHPFAILTAILTKILNVPYVEEINGTYEDVLHAYPFLRNIESFVKLITALRLKLTDGCIAVTSELAEWLLYDLNIKLVIVIPNAANTDLFRPNSYSQYRFSNPYVVFFGSLARWQGIETMLMSTRTSSWPPEVSLLIVGDGALRSEVQEEANTNPRIIYLPKQPYELLPGIVSNSLAGLSVQSNYNRRSERGLYPLKFFETLACGIPAIVTDFPGQADLVERHHCGIVIPCDNADALAEAVAQLYSNSALRQELGKNARQAVVQYHSWDNRASMTSEFLRLLISKNSIST